ncbi:MAG: hypothetical protein WAQ98_17025 [Blastocatellia bacterium]
MPIIFLTPHRVKVGIKVEYQLTEFSKKFSKILADIDELDDFIEQNLSS